MSLSTDHCLSVQAKDVAHIDFDLVTKGHLRLTWPGSCRHLYHGHIGNRRSSLRLCHYQPEQYQQSAGKIFIYCNWSTCILAAGSQAADVCQKGADGINRID